MWFRRSSVALPTEVEQARKELCKLAEARPSLATAARIHEVLLQRLWSVPVTESPPAITAEQARSKLVSAIPLLRGENVLVDRKAWSMRWLGVCDALQEPAPLARTVREVVAAGRLDPADVTACVIATDVD